MTDRQVRVGPVPQVDRSGLPNGNIYFLTDDERKAVLWAIGVGLQNDDGFPTPRDQNRKILRSAEDRLS